MPVSSVEQPQLGSALKDYRIGKLWTLQRLAKKTGVSTSTLHKIERGVRPSDLTRARIRKALPDFDPNGGTA